MSAGSTTLSPSKAAAAALATIDLKGYDAEQSRLMDERCILVDEQDEPLGAADKKTCTSSDIDSFPADRSAMSLQAI